MSLSPLSGSPRIDPRLQPDAIAQAAAQLAFPPDLQALTLRAAQRLILIPSGVQWAGDMLDQLDRVQDSAQLPRETWAVPEQLRSLDEQESVADLWPLVVLLARVPEAIRLHEQRDIPHAVTLDTLDDLLRWAQKFRIQQGRWGLAETHWLIHAVTGHIFRLGRLQFEWVTCRWPDLPFHENEWLLSVHIPEMEPMDPHACDESFARAAAFFPHHFPQRPASAYVCDSWLLDPQLKEYLPATSNIVRFQNRFTLVPAAFYDRDQLTPRILPPLIPPLIPPLTNPRYPQTSMIRIRSRPPLGSADYTGPSSRTTTKAAAGKAASATDRYE